MPGGRAGEIVSRRETPSQCGRVGSPGGEYKIKDVSSTRDLVGSVTN